MAQQRELIKVEDNRLYSISSDSAVIKYNGTMNSKLAFNIPTFVQTQTDIQSIYFSINSAVIPSSFYNINANNNGFYFNNVLYKFTIGNYNINQFITMANTILSSSCVLSYNVITNKITLAVTGSYNIDGTKSSCYRIIGMSYAILSGTTLITFPNCCDLLSTPRLFVRSTAIDANNYSDETSSSDVLGIIANTANPNGVIHFYNYNNIRNLITTPNISTFDISITNDDKQYVDFNGCPIYLTLCITTIREIERPVSFTEMLHRSYDLEQYNAIKAMEPFTIPLGKT